MRVLKFLGVVGTTLILSACGYNWEHSVPAVHFSLGSSAICKDCHETLDAVAAEVKKRGYLNYHVRLQGYTDTVGDKASNERLAHRRVEAVKKALIDRGVMASRISTRIFGERDQRVDTHDGVIEVENRRVEIYLNTQEGKKAFFGYM